MNKKEENQYSENKNNPKILHLYLCKAEQEYHFFKITYRKIDVSKINQS